jgi:3-methyladenine DNA glycosylase AlkC
MKHHTAKSGKDAFTFSQDELDQLAIHCQIIRNAELLDPPCIEKNVEGMVANMEDWASKKPCHIRPLSAAQVRFMNDVLAKFSLAPFDAQPPSSVVVTPHENERHFAQLHARIDHLNAKLERIMSMLPQPKPLLGSSATTVMAKAPTKLRALSLKGREGDKPLPN